MLRLIRHCACFAIAFVALAAPAAAQQSSSGGAVFTPPPPPPEEAAIVNGRAVAPASAPPRVQAAIAAANEIVEKPYVYGGGHRPFTGRLARGYDCSGAVSQALYGGRFLRSPLDSSSFMRWARKGVGRWITVYTAPSHAYVVIAGLRFDTSMRDPDAPGPGTGPRWSTRLRTSGSFVARHPRGY